MRRLLFLAGIACLFLSGCAYYNTFYLANKAWSQAMTEREKNPNETPTGAELQDYDDCIRASNNLLAKYPTSKYVDDALLLIGRCRLGKGDYELAIDQFQLLQDSLPQSPLVPSAGVGKGQALLKLRRFVEAESTLTTVLQKYPDFADRDELLLALGDAKRGQKQVRKALLLWGDLLKVTKKNTVRYLALNRRGETYFQLEEFDSARVEFEQVAGEARRQQDRIAAELRIGQSFEEAHSYDRAIEYYRLLQPDAARQNREPEVLLRIAGVEVLRGNVARAEDMYLKILDINKGNPYGTSAAYELGYLYENYKDDFDKAGTYYEQVKSLPHSQVTDQAAERQAGLTKAAEFRKRLLETGGHFDQQAESAYSLGELYYFQMKKPLRALLQFLHVERIFSYTRFGPKAAYAAGWTLAQMDSLGVADSAFARAAARYPSTTFGAAALDSLKAHFGPRADSVLAAGRADTTNIPVPKPPEAVQDSIRQVAYDDSVRKAVVADSLRKVAVQDSLERAQATRRARQASADSARMAADSLARRIKPPGATGPGLDTTASLAPGQSGTGSRPIRGIRPVPRTPGDSAGVTPGSRADSMNAAPPGAPSDSTRRPPPPPPPAVPPDSTVRREPPVPPPAPPDTSAAPPARKLPQGEEPLPPGASPPDTSGAVPGAGKD